jgi:hypothetical protein
MGVKKLALSFAAAAGLVAMMLPGCGGDDPNPDDPNFGTSSGDGGKRDSGPGGPKVCLLNNCNADAHCADCSGGKTVCNRAEKRCVACGPGAGGKECGPGTYCTPFGDCVPNGVTCNVDATGEPTVACKSNADCAACDPSHKVCDGGKCVGCVDNDLTNCQSTDVCKKNKCVAACPQTCNTDGDCDSCGAPTKEAHACNKHVCAQCSPTKACPASQTCDYEHGTCIKNCGVPNKPPGACLKDDDCAGCTGTTKCKLPVNGGFGVCQVPATGCSDIGKGVFVLPDPFGKFTQSCSTDPDCANVSLDYNLGKDLRDITGIGGIGDAKIQYPMHACASVEVLDKSCGVCVPCKKDADCTPIDIDKVAGEAFGPIGSVASAILLDKVFGPNDHKLNMYCQKVAGAFGICAPCSNPLAACGNGLTPAPAGSCTHDACVEGEKLGANCSSCIAKVCEKDAFCCTQKWDYQCTAEVDAFCDDKSCLPPYSCLYKTAGWYCDANNNKTAYRCDGQLRETYPCPGGNQQYCRKVGTGTKDPAIVGGDGKPVCYPTP